MIAPCNTHALSNKFLLKCNASAPRLIQRLSIILQSHAGGRTSSGESGEVHVIIPDILLLQFLYSHQVVSRCRLPVYVFHNTKLSVMNYQHHQGPFAGPPGNRAVGISGGYSCIWLLTSSQRSSESATEMPIESLLPAVSAHRGCYIG